MATIFLLVLIYMSFISLGLPDALLGAAWPAMRLEWSLPLDAAGLVAIPSIISTVASSLLSGIIIRKLGTGKITFISCILTGTALLGFSLAPSFVWLFVLSVPLGFGAGSVDSALNNYVALHFKAHHMNWLHSFWGVGATMGPLILAGKFAAGETWRNGYATVATIQLSLALLLFLTLPLWKTHKKQPVYNSDADIRIGKQDRDNGRKNVFKTKGLIYALLTFFFYCTSEVSVGLWGSSFLIQTKNIPIETAATWISMYYGGITIGRLLSGFISFRLSNTQMIRLGIGISLSGIILIILPLPDFMALISLMMIGFGFSPIFPSMIHSTPNNFGSKNSQTIIGFQMAFGYMGCAIMPPLIGVALRNISMSLFPFFVLSSLLLILFCTENLAQIMRVKKKTVTP